MEDDKPLRRRRRWFIALGAIAGLAIIQSVTFTPAVEVRYVEDATGAPIDGMTVTAVWRFYAVGLIDRLPTRVLKVQSVQTNSEGTAYVPPSLMFHPPVFPFSLSSRQIDALPVLFVNEARYRPHAAVAGYEQREPSITLLTLQKTSIDETTVRLIRLHSIPSTREKADLDFVRREVDDKVDDALDYCRKSRLCQSPGQRL
jgi:hypothetical protein